MEPKAQCGNSRIFQPLRFFRENKIHCRRIELSKQLDQNWFHVNSEWQKNSKISTLCNEDFELLKCGIRFLQPFFLIQKNYHLNQKSSEINLDELLTKNECWKLKTIEHEHFPFKYVSDLWTFVALICQNLSIHRTNLIMTLADYCNIERWAIITNVTGIW